VLWSAVGLPAVALAFALFFLNDAAVGARPGLLFGFVLAADACLLALAWLDDRLPSLHLVAGLAVFTLLSLWTAVHLTDALLPWALALYLGFAALHAVFPLVLERHRATAAPTWWSQLFPPLALLLMLLPIFKLETVSFLIWPAILLVDLLAVGLAVLSASLAAVAAVLGLTLAATGLCLFRVPVTVGLAPSLLLVIGGFAVFFFAASLWLGRRLGNKLPAADRQLAAVFGDARAQLPAFASLLPFLLLIMACARLPVPDPSAVFGLGLLLVVLTLGLARILVIEWLPACALAGMAGLELVWHSRHFHPGAAGGPLAWYVGCYAVFAVYPFLFRRDFARLTGPWAVAALSGGAHFWLVYQTIKAAWPNDYLGAVPAAFALAPLGSLVIILRTVPADNPRRLGQLAWFGGVALGFITLVFPVQFDRQWLTVAWALEGAALLWLFHRVPHPGLRATGAGLLVTAFVRLALNPAVLGYHVRGDTGILNWYLYAYGLATAALFAGAKLLVPPRERVFGLNTPPLLNTLGVVLAFFLVNIEIADFFTAPGSPSLAFTFSGDLARDMTYTIAWALFALGLLVGGIRQQQRAARYAAIALLSIALLKLFFHDLANLEALYRTARSSPSPSSPWSPPSPTNAFCRAMKNRLRPNHNVNGFAATGGVVLLALVAATSGFGALAPTEWSHRQALSVDAPGLVRIAVPAATFDANQPGLADLRLIDASGREISYLLDSPAPPAGDEFKNRLFRPQSFESPPGSADTTQLVVATGSAEKLDAIELESSAPFFLKAAHVDASPDGKEWQSLGAAVPVFRQFGAEQLRLPLNRLSAAFVRITLDDLNSRPVVFTGARLLRAPAQAAPPPLVALGAALIRRDEFVGESVITVSLDGRHVPLAALEFETKEPLFMRRVTVAVREVNGAESAERTVGAGTLYRVALAGAPARAQLELPLEFTPLTRELLIHIHNGDSPPLVIDAVRARQHPVSLLFMAPAPGAYTLLSGNPQAIVPRYDLAAFAGELGKATATATTPGELEAMPDYRPRESLSTAPLPDVPLTGAPLDAKEWRHRQAIQISRTGVQELELNLAALAQARPDYADLRVLRAGNQIPYVLEQPALARALTLAPAPDPDPKQPTVSVWRLTLPHANLPFRRILLTSVTPLFSRECRIYEKVADQNGGTSEITLASGQWSRMPKPGVPESRAFDLSESPRTGTLWIETDNGDNPAITLDGAQAVYPVVRLVFKVADTDGFTLACGNPQARAPRYDLSLVAAKLLTASRNVAQLPADDPGVTDPASGNLFGGIANRYIFWAALALAVVVLLVVVAKLLPKPPAP
jgi:hypothetical protein